MRDARSFFTSARLPIATAVLAVGILVADTVTRVDIAVAVLYVAVVLLAARFYSPSRVLLVGTGCVALTILSYLITRSSGPVVEGIANMLISIGTIALITPLVLKNQTRELQLRLARDHLQVEVERRTQQAVLLDQTHDSIFLRDANGVIMFWNRGAQELYGWSAEEVVGKLAKDVLETVFSIPLEEINAELRRTGRWEGELIRTKKDGSQVEIASRWSLQRDKTGVPVAILETNNDISDRKRAEEAVRRSERELRDLFDTMPGIVMAARPDGFNEFQSRNWLEYSGLSAEASMGHGWTAAVHPDDFDAHVSKWRVSRDSGEPFEDEVRHRNAKGEYRWFLGRAKPLRDERGKILKWYGILTDIDDRKRAECLLAGEKRILEMVAKGDSLGQILEALCRLVEEQVSGSLASVALLDGDRLRRGGAPSLPKDYIDELDGFANGPLASFCAKAAYRGEQVIVEDIAVDPLWANYRDLALRYSLRACWSTPVFSSQDKVIATFAMYYREPRSPSSRDQEFIKQITHTAQVVIERKLIQEALRRSEAHLADAQRLTHTGSWARNPEGEIYWSEETYRIWGLDPHHAPLDLETILQRVHPEDRKKVESTLGERGDFERDYRIVLPDGTVKYIHSAGHPVFSVGAELVEMVGTVVDLTERKRGQEERERTEEALRRSEAHLAQAQRLTHTGGWARSPKGDVYWSEEMFRIWGFDLMGRPPDRDTVLQRVHPDDRDRTRQNGDEAMRDGTGIDHEYRIILPDGTVRHIHAVGRPIHSASGEMVEMVGTAVDVTERKRAEKERERTEEALRRSEAHLAQAQRLTRTGSWARSLKGDAYWSEEMFRIWGFDLMERPPDPDTYVQRIHPDDRDKFENGRKAMQCGTGLDDEYRINFPDGTIRYIHVVGRPIFNTSGEMIEGVGAAVDVTEQKRAEGERERLLQLEANLAHMNRVSVMGEMSASLAHELKQPMAAAMMNAEVCLELVHRNRIDIQEFSDATSAILRSVKRAAEIIDRLRSLSRKSNPQRELVDINQAIREIGALLRNEARMSSVAVRLELTREAPQITGDRVQLQQVVLNLMLNALESMKERGGDLVLRSELTGTRDVLISVSDTGIGIPAGNEEQIFDAFFTTKSQGTGMGLAISRTIVELHGGRLFARGNVGPGATFCIELPQEIGRSL